MKKQTKEILQKLLVLPVTERQDVIACLIYKAVEHLDEAEAQKKYRTIIQTLSQNL
tara:strand:+ start:319 stop:486 length:168 start_codon:yes stop_codon:yes gene_type:complete